MKCPEDYWPLIHSALSGPQGRNGLASGYTTPLLLALPIQTVRSPKLDYSLLPKFAIHIVLPNLRSHYLFLLLSILLPQPNNALVLLPFLAASIPDEQPLETAIFGDATIYNSQLVGFFKVYYSYTFFIQQDLVTSSKLSPWQFHLNISKWPKINMPQTEFKTIPKPGPLPVQFSPPRWMASVTQARNRGESSSSPTLPSSSARTYHGILLMLSPRISAVNRNPAVSTTNLVWHCFNRFYYYLGTVRPTDQMAAATKIVHSTHNSQEREYMSH